MDNIDKRVAELFKDLCNAPTGVIKEDFTNVTMKDKFTDLFIRTIAGHLVACDYVKKTEDLVEVVRCKKCIYHQNVDFDDESYMVCTRNDNYTTTYGDAYCMYGEVDNDI